jgi:hypothetical protein
LNGPFSLPGAQIQDIGLTLRVQSQNGVNWATVIGPDEVLEDDMIDNKPLRRNEQHVMPDKMSGALLVQECRRAADTAM